MLFGVDLTAFLSKHLVDSITAPSYVRVVLIADPLFFMAKRLLPSQAILREALRIVLQEVLPFEGAPCL